VRGKARAVRGSECVEKKNTSSIEKAILECSSKGVLGVRIGLADFNFGSVNFILKCSS
jgi:hypothetical protein